VCVCVGGGLRELAVTAAGVGMGGCCYFSGSRVSSTISLASIVGMGERA